MTTLTTSHGLHAVDAASIPAAPRGVTPFDAAGKQRLLKMTETQRSEVLGALDEVAVKGPKLKEDLGRYAPDPSEAQLHVQKLEAARSATLKAEALASYSRDVEASANHDAMTYLLAVKTELLHIVQNHDAQLATEYPRVTALVEQRRDAILEGRARAKAEPAEGVATPAATAPVAPKG
ncbi:MAG: hypothetical protein WCI05_07670 [Myxococcales bacterium]